MTLRGRALSAFIGGALLAAGVAPAQAEEVAIVRDESFGGAGGRKSAG